jgi:MerR family copper efflux transcriptional regulator
MNIGSLAAATGVPAKTIRYYESIGLLVPALRSNSNYRVYGSSDVARLRFIQSARRLGFSIKEVGALLALWHDKSRASAQVRTLALDHIRDIDRKIAELQGIRATLQDLVEHCHGDERPDCPILTALADGTVRHEGDEEGPECAKAH